MLKTTKRRQYVIVTLQVMEVLMHSLEALHCNNCEMKVPFILGEAGDSGFDLFKLHVLSQFWVCYLRQFAWTSGIPLMSMTFGQNLLTDHNCPSGSAGTMVTLEGIRHSCFSGSNPRKAGGDIYQQRVMVTVTGVLGCDYTSLKSKSLLRKGSSKWTGVSWSTWHCADQRYEETDKGHPGHLSKGHI